MIGGAGREGGRGGEGEHDGEGEGGCKGYIFKFE